MQSRGNGVRRGSKTQFPESTKTLKGQDLYIGSLLFLIKSAPTPRLRFNMFLEYEPLSGKIEIDKKTTKTIEKLDKLLLGRTTTVQLLDDVVAEELTV